MIDPLLSLAFGIQSNKGVFAVLLGSGISRAAGIPTGWDVVLDLSRKLAAMMSEDCGEDPAAWYKTKFGKQPDYSELLDALCKTPAERQQLLRSYFEPNEDERAQELKQPTKAHRAIGKLVVQGFVRVILTTNFDRLLERAIEDEGLSPVVISTADGLEGAMPLAHQRCCIVKLHGDYLDTRIKNTPSEIEVYDKRTNKFLDQVLDQFGLVVCGWSAQWDVALRAAFERCRSRRFTMYWASRGELQLEAKKLLALRAGVSISIVDADGFFSKLTDLVEGLEKSNQPHPASIEALAAITKRYLADPKLFIELADLVHQEIETALKSLQETGKRYLELRDVAQAYSEYRADLARLQTVLIHGCTFGHSEHIPLWIDIVQRIAQPARAGVSQPSPGIKLYPAILLLYSGGLAALGAGRMETVAQLLTKPMYKEHGGERLRLVVHGHMWGDIAEQCTRIPEFKQSRLAKSLHLHSVLRRPLYRYLPDDEVYDLRFDEFEYLLALAFLDLDKIYGMIAPSAPPGRFTFQCRHDHNKTSIVFAAERDLQEQQENWPPLKAGLFGGKVERAKELQTMLLEVIAKSPY